MCCRVHDPGVSPSCSARSASSRFSQKLSRTRPSNFGQHLRGEAVHIIGFYRPQPTSGYFGGRQDRAATAEPGRQGPVRFPVGISPKRTGGFRPDYATPDRRRAQNQPFGFAPISVIQRCSAAAWKQTLLKFLRSRLCECWCFPNLPERSWPQIARPGERTEPFAQECTATSTASQKRCAIEEGGITPAFLR